jgi:hypothetical protein
MSKVLFAAALLSFVIFFAACGSAPENNSNANNSAGTGNVAVDANNLPPGLTASPLPPSANTTPGIPDPKVANNVPKGATPTPGIPDPAEMKKPFKPGATPTPGIPRPEELRRQMGRTNVNVNAPVEGDTMMMKGRKKPGPVNRPE